MAELARRWRQCSISQCSKRTLRRSLRRTAPVPCTPAATDTRPGDDVDPPGEQIEDEWFTTARTCAMADDRRGRQVQSGSHRATHLAWLAGVCCIDASGRYEMVATVHSAHARCVRPATLSATGRLSAISGLSDRIARNRRRPDRELG